MQRLILTAAVLALLTACKQEQNDIPSVQPSAPEAAAPAENGVRDMPAQPDRPVGDAFQTPLPEGVVLTQPHHSRMDLAVPNRNGTMGRRTGFEYLDGDARQAMQEFAEAMATAGFASPDGPVIEEGVVRQVFKKPGYGTVFARAQEQEATRRTHASARAFVVVAWPK